jgi:hypothetical protein
MPARIRETRWLGVLWCFGHSQAPIRLPTSSAAPVHERWNGGAFPGGRHPARLPRPPRLGRLISPTATATPASALPFIVSGPSPRVSSPEPLAVPRRPEGNAIGAPAVGAVVSAEAPDLVTRRTPTMSSRRRTLLIALAVAILGSAALVSWQFYLRSRIVPYDFGRISVGMTRQQVVAILGPPTKVWPPEVWPPDPTPRSFQIEFWHETWDSGRWHLASVFRERNGGTLRLVRKGRFV